MYPVKNGTPVLIDESQSLFRIADMLHEPSKASVKRKGIKQIIIGAVTFLKRVLPPLSFNLVAAKNFRKFSELLMQQSPTLNGASGHLHNCLCFDADSPTYGFSEKKGLILI